MFKERSEFQMRSARPEKVTSTISAMVINRFFFVFCLVLFMSRVSAGAELNETQLLQQLRTQSGTDAYITANKLGHLGSVEGLKALIGVGNEKLFMAYGSGLNSYRFGVHAPLDPQLEGLLIQYYRAPNASPILAQFTIDNNNKYQTQELFDRLYTHLLQPGQTEPVSSTWASTITLTDLEGIEPALFDALPRLPVEGQYAILVALGKRRFVAAIPPLEAMLQSEKPNSNKENGICLALTRIGTKKSVAIVLKRIAWLTRQIPPEEPLDPRYEGKGLGMQYLLDQMPPEERKRRESEGLVRHDIYVGTLTIIGHLATMPEDAPLDYKELKRALPSDLDDKTASALIALIKNRHEEAGVPDLQGYLSNRKHREEAVDALRNLNKNQQAQTIGGGPGWFQLRDEQRRIFKLMSGRPDQFVLDYEKNLIAMEKIADEQADASSATGEFQEIMQGYMVLGDVARFTLHRPDQAIRFYQKSEQLNPRADRRGWIFPSVRLADTYQYDLKDTAKAIASYQSALDLLSASHLQGFLENPFKGDWWRNWLTVEIDYLRTGRPFSGVIDRESVAGLYLAALIMQRSTVQQVNFDTGLTLDRGTGSYTADPGLDPKMVVLEKLQQLPHSHLVLSSTIQALSYLPTPESIVAYLESQDPGRYWSAAILGLAIFQDSLSAYVSEREPLPLLLPGAADKESGRTSPWRLAAEQFQKKTGVHFDLGPDTQFASPEKTWEYFLRSLQEGNTQAVFSCMTPVMKARFQSLSSRLSPEEMKQMAQSFSKFSLQEDMGKRREYTVARKKGDKTSVGFIYFINNLGEWKIQDM